MSDDAIVLLKEDHRNVRKLFRQFHSAEEPEQRGRLVDKIIEELTVHTYIENEVMYPQVRKLVPDLEQDILESFEEHHVADVLCVELTALAPTDEHYEAKATVLIENVDHHIDEEEGEWFPKVRAALGRKQLQEIGRELQAARERAPRKPTQPSALRKAVDALVG
jgi:hemerythrin-like domain-containing protein